MRPEFDLRDMLSVRAVNAVSVNGTIGRVRCEKSPQAMHITDDVLSRIWWIARQSCVHRILEMFVAYPCAALAKKRSAIDALNPTIGQRKKLIS
jgi:hypothetical protein